MAHVIAQGTDPANRRRCAAPENSPFVLGRETAEFSVPWDRQVSKNHARLEYRDGLLQVERLPEARNPIFFRGGEGDRFSVAPGEHFVIGGTTFTFSDTAVEVDRRARRPDEETAFAPGDLGRTQFRNARARIEVLARLPDVIRGAQSDTELVARVVSMILAGVPAADSVALVEWPQPLGAKSPPRVLQWDERTVGRAARQPSERLIRAALEKSAGVLHVWRGAPQSQFTAREDVDWAFCTPVPGTSCRGWGLYVAGRIHAGESDSPSEFDPADLRDDLKFTEVAAATIGSLCDVKHLERQRAGLSHFFSPVVLAALERHDPSEVLAPREAEVSVLFCDLRGFARQAEQSTGDLMGLLERVSRVLGVTTRHVLDQEGVVGDFHGDAVMGFWGWPLEQLDRISRACLTALSIRRELLSASRQADDPLRGFHMGIGIASGRAVAGRIGTSDQAKVTVFGPVVNLASRLEEMTKVLRAPIVIDHETARAVRQTVPPTMARCRRLAVVQPYGMYQPVEVSELLPPASMDASLSDDDLARYEEALDQFLAGQWQEAFRKLHQITADDRTKDFLTVHIAQHGRVPPDGWNGVIRV